MIFQHLMVTLLLGFLCLFTFKPQLIVSKNKAYFMPITMPNHIWW